MGKTGLVAVAGNSISVFHDAHLTSDLISNM